jgi:hypothetical protein
MVIPACRTHALLVRLWPEPDGAGQIVWRGSIDYVQTGERCYFQTLDGLSAQIALLLSRAAQRAEDLDAEEN